MALTPDEQAIKDELIRQIKASEAALAIPPSG